jgi:hypothetical protein
MVFISESLPDDFVIPEYFMNAGIGRAEYDIGSTLT